MSPTLRASRWGAQPFNAYIQGPLAPALQQVAPEAYEGRVRRLGIVNAWADPNFKAAAVVAGRKQLVMAGVTTDICLVLPSINAVDDGYTVQAAMDASDPRLSYRRTLRGV
jgi:hypothetical protein